MTKKKTENPESFKPVKVNDVVKVVCAEPLALFNQTRSAKVLEVSPCGRVISAEIIGDFGKEKAPVMRAMPYWPADSEKRKTNIWFHVDEESAEPDAAAS